jgi:general secretion pathway protein H
MFASSKSQGFSLLELLVALFVVVMITAVVTLSVSSSGQGTRLDSLVNNLSNVAGYAMDEAQLSGIDYGLLVFSRIDAAGDEVWGFDWRERRPEGWRVPRRDEEIFAEQVFPPGVELSLELEDHPLSEMSGEDDDEEATPQVVFFSSGETMPGALEVRREPEGDLLWRVEWDLLGRFSLMRRGIPNDEEDGV